MDRAIRRSLLEKVRDSRALRYLTGKMLAIEFFHALASRYYAGLGSIVVLHRVVPRFADLTPLPSFGGEIDAGFLRDILAFCRAQRIAIVPLDEVANRLASARKGNHRERFVAFTFDDGWRDNLTLALPIFRQMNAPLAIYVATGLSDRAALSWKYNVADILLSQRELSFSVEGKAYHFDISTLAGKDAAYRAVLALLIEAEPVTRHQVLNAIVGGDAAALARKANQLMLGWEEIKALASDPLVTIGAHSEHHYNLARLDDAQLRAEVEGSKRKLEAVLDRRIDHFAYPYGGRAHAGPREFAAAREAGFRTATTTRIGNLFADHARLMHCLPRIPASGKLNWIGYFRASQSGLVPAIANRFKRVVTE
jgi:peptidoglycan/xylan/chitin deacetylase (PgdA/CDA1 family)